MTAMEDDVALKLLHTADWHLGKRFEQFAGSETTLTRARLDVLDVILGVAERYAVDAVLCAGDLFDDAFVEPKWWEPLVAKFQKRAWSQRPVFFLPGNHDPLIAGAIWLDSRFRRALPPWVHVIDEDLFTFELSNEAVLYAVPCKSRAGQGDPCLTIPVREPKDQRIRIGLVHGSTFDLPDCQTSFPIARDSAVERGLDYLAIGDTHSFRLVPQDRLIPPTVYPGAPEPTAFDEKDPGNVAVVFVNRRREARVQREPVKTWTWEEIEVRNLGELRKLRDRQDLIRRVLRLRVAMNVPAAEYDEAERILSELAGTEAVHGKVGVMALDRTGFMLDTADIATVLGDLPPVLLATVERLKAAEAAAQDPEIARRALYRLYQLARRAS